MYSKWSDGGLAVCGQCRYDPDFRRVGANQTRRCTVVLPGYKKMNPAAQKQETVWITVIAWGDLAEVLSTAYKGCPVMAVGRLEKNEWKGKTYTNLVADFLSVCSPSAAMMEMQQKYSEKTPEKSQAQAIQEDNYEYEVPF